MRERPLVGERDAGLLGEGTQRGFNILERGLGVLLDGIQLVHGEHDGGHAQQLGQQALVGQVDASVDAFHASAERFDAGVAEGAQLRLGITLRIHLVDVGLEHLPLALHEVLPLGLGHFRQGTGRKLDVLAPCQFGVQPRDAQCSVRDPPPRLGKLVFDDKRTVLIARFHRRAIEAARHRNGMKHRHGGPVGERPRRVDIADHVDHRHVLGAGLQHHLDRLQHLGQVEIGIVATQLAGLDRGEIQHVIHHQPQRARGGLDHLRAVALLAGQRVHAAVVIDVGADVAVHHFLPSAVTPVALRPSKLSPVAVAPEITVRLGRARALASR